MLRYNKSVQNRIDINIMNYKRFATKYIIFEEENKVKEYKIYSDELIYEGEYLNGKRNGKGKEYGSYGRLIFEGEYLNGKKNGKGKEFFDNKLIFEGEYLNDKKWNGKGYDIDNNIIYELKNGNGSIKDDYFKGEYINGEKNGKGKEYSEYGRLIFEGEYLNGKRNGKGKEYSEYDYLIFEGEYLNGKRNGKGKEYKEFYLIFEGEYLNDKKWNGRLYTEDNNIKYELNNGKGFFLEYDRDKGIYYEGEFINGLRSGMGK